MREKIDDSLGKDPTCNDEEDGRERGTIKGFRSGQNDAACYYAHAMSTDIE
jgi:hypothetical protein